MSNFLRDSGDINSEKGREIKSHLQSVKKTFDNEEARRFPGAKELRPGESRNPITNDSEGETVAKTVKNVSLKVACENFSPRGENGPTAREVRGEPEKNKGIFASVVERMVQGNARKRTPLPSMDEASLKRRRPGPVHTQKAQEKEPEVVKNEGVGNTSFELLLERERLEREVELQKVSHRRQLSNLNQ